MKRIHIFFLLIIWYVALALGSLSWRSKVHAESAPFTPQGVKGISTEPLQSPVPTLAKYPSLDTSALPRIYAQEFALYNPESGKVVAVSKNMEPVPIASTTKTMTALLVAKADDLSDVITITDEAVGQPAASSMMGVHVGERISVEKLLYGALLVSGNDAAYALAEYQGGKLLGSSKATPNEKVARFVTEMNKKAAELGMHDTRYHDPVGINDDGRSTALDLAKLIGEVGKIRSLHTIMSTPTIALADEDGRYRYDLRNSNRFVTDYAYEGVVAGKTGYTDAAGHCLITAIQRNGVTLAVAILHTTSQTNEASAVEARKLIEAGFSLIQWD